MSEQPFETQYDGARATGHGLAALLVVTAEALRDMDDDRRYDFELVIEEVSDDA